MSNKCPKDLDSSLSIWDKLSLSCMNVEIWKSPGKQNSDNKLSLNSVASEWTTIPCCMVPHRHTIMAWKKDLTMMPPLSPKPHHATPPYCCAKQPTYMPASLPNAYLPACLPACLPYILLPLPPTTTSWKMMKDFWLLHNWPSYWRKKSKQDDMTDSTSTAMGNA